MKQKIVPLSEQMRAIILGSILGDGSLKLASQYKNARFSFRHSVKQKEYFYWKVAQLKEISSRSSIFRQAPDGWSKEEKLRYQSAALPALTEIYSLVTRRHKLIIRRKWLNQMSPLSLAIWWFDDGSIIGNGRKGVFCTDGFDYEAVKILSRYLEKVWQIKTHLGMVKQKNGSRDAYWRLWLPATEELKKFLRLIMPYARIKALLPKIILLYSDNQLQQRWISEIIQATGLPRYEIEVAVAAKKAKWKRFQRMI